MRLPGRARVRHPHSFAAVRCARQPRSERGGTDSGTKQDRRDPEVIFPLRRLVTESKDDHLALEALWALYVSGGLDDALVE